MLYIRVLEDKLDAKHNEQTAEEYTRESENKGLSKLFFEDVPVRVEATFEDQYRQEDHQNTVRVDFADGLYSLTEITQICAELAKYDSRYEEHRCVRDLQ